MLGAAAASLAALGLAYFLRDPERRPPTDPRAILAPADGRVLRVEHAATPAFVDGPAWRIVIFLSLWDVHVQRAPAAGPNTTGIHSYPRSGPLVLCAMKVSSPRKNSLTAASSSMTWSRESGSRRSRLTGGKIVDR